MARITLILGGVRSGKSAYAETLAAQAGRRKIYVATAEALDAEMRERIEKHRQRRGSDWLSLEVPLQLADTIASPDYADAVILVDCLTLWLSNLLCRDLPVDEYVEQFLAGLKRTKAQVVLVSNEVGQGIVPDNALARRFRDEAGLLHQKVAAIAGDVVWMVAGIPTIIKIAA